MTPELQHAPLLSPVGAAASTGSVVSIRRRQGWWVALSVGVYWLSVSLVPVYNKTIFSKAYYPYPVATAAIQLGMVSLTLGLANVLKHLLIQACVSPEPKCRGTYQELPADAEAGGDRSGQKPEPSSWVGGPHYLYKLWAIAPVGVLFGLKYGITNWGLHLVPTSVHVLLQSTDILWTVAAAYFINGERQRPMQLLACGGTMLGTILIGLRLNQSMEAAAWPLAINLMTPALLGLCIATLRRATVLLMTPSGPLKGTMTSVELTCHKLYLSAFSALFCAVLIEGLDVLGTLKERPPFWTALAANRGLLVGLSGGAGLVLIFQVNITWLSALTSATSVGIVGGVKVVPQWLMNLLFELKVDVSALNLTGAGIVLVSSMLWTFTRMRTSRVLQELQACGAGPTAPLSPSPAQQLL